MEPLVAFIGPQIDDLFHFILEAMHPQSVSYSRVEIISRVVLRTLNNTLSKSPINPNDLSRINCWKIASQYHVDHVS